MSSMASFLNNGMDTNPYARIAAATGGAAVITLGLLALKYNDRALFHEARDDMPRVKGDPIVGGLFRQLANKDRTYDQQCQHFERLDTLTFAASTIGMAPAVLTINPVNVEYFLKTNFENYIKGEHMLKSLGHFLGKGIFIANGERWRYQRKTASHIFNIVNFRNHFTGVFVKELNVLSSHILDKKVHSGKPVDFQDVMFKFTVDSFVLLAFGAEINALKSRGKVPFAASFDECQHDCLDRFINPFMPIVEALKPIIRPGTMTIKQHLKVIDDFAYGIINERRKQLAEGGEFKDLLSRFMNTRNEHGELLSDDELRDTSLNFILAGRDTTAQALSWTFYNLMLHPRVETKLFEEIKAHIRDEHENDSPALYEVIKDKMTYAHAVFYEVLRLYPPVPSNIKVALGDDVWPDGTRIRKGDSVAWSTYAQGRSTKVWGPDARVFRPERWITPEGELRRESQGQWPIFHAGPRICLGQALATLESLVAMIMLLRRYKFTLAPNQEIHYKVSLTMPMKNGMKVFVEKRELTH
ncbi:cytochrome P450 [Zychaea mexicana]|uniref:cytochrome P450 n=1 Tax=Zychaea mexicana TaxID=64656 RepID=UPI0022FF1F20|nr:cytochrome P450 [Zychaea mexicana]KAI9488566.1 cytochrome P450 [Zychaea mexicana]